ncbi:hypothetical protein E1B28_004904 [Marasmius oreades]|uniref:Uncharacterized protein n=1 Tax=Marasmius oreades TaxID=181124 RepID=A0A9P7UZL9_9AGAR|nr:uncharacterized protein E1B28_004904 [Marasmius oreades]KAG7097567.1 hypothetical protein E1B28_004904 [Marasmius oreades]
MTPNNTTSTRPLAISFRTNSSPPNVLGSTGSVVYVWNEENTCVAFVTSMSHVYWRKVPAGGMAERGGGKTTDVPRTTLDVDYSTLLPTIPPIITALAGDLKRNSIRSDLVPVATLVGNVLVNVKVTGMLFTTGDPFSDVVLKEVEVIVKTVVGDGGSTGKFLRVGNGVKVQQFGLRRSSLLRTARAASWAFARLQEVRIPEIFETTQIVINRSLGQLEDAGDSDEDDLSRVFLGAASDGLEHISPMLKSDSIEPASKKEKERWGEMECSRHFSTASQHM